MSLFGAPAIACGDELLALPFERRTQLLALLALRRGWVGRAEIAALLWPDQEHRLALTNLRKSLHRLQSLPGAELLEAHGNALRFEVRTDVHEFEASLRDGRAEDALALHRGPLLLGFEDDGNEAWSNWLRFERDRLLVAWRGAAQARLAGEGDATGAIDLASRMLEADPLDEAALRSFMEWLARTGQVARARQAYRDFAVRLAAELGLAPSAELKALNDALGSTGIAVAAQPSPVAGDGLVGRTVELRRVAALLAQDDCRLLTVTGPGGVGKTRLARRVIDECAQLFPDGASFVALDDLDAVGDFGGRLARELDVTPRGRADPLDQVIEALRARRALLVLDNFEQLGGAAPLLDRLLTACPGVKAVVTSRVRLALASEWLLPLEGLPWPEDEDRDHLESFDAVRLFVRAARRVRPEFSPAAEAPAIIDICRQVQGLPLALELAAAWTRVLSCAVIAGELRHGSELLQATDGAQPSRHASIEVVFEQSWRLLADVERDALARLSVFAGGFSPAAARAVTRAPLPVLAALADKSLLHRDADRLHLHPLVQQLAAAKLGDGAMAAETAAAHAAYFHRFLAQLGTTTESGDRQALHRIDDDFENCRRAWHWAVEQGQSALLQASSRTLLDYADYRGRFGDGLALLREAIDAPVARSDPGLEALMLSRAAHLEYRLDRYGEAEALAERVLAMTRRNRGGAARLQALNVLGTCAYRMGRLAEARRYFTQRLELASPAEQAHTAAVTLDHLALIEKRLGRYPEALGLSLRSLAEHRRLGDSAGEALCLNNLGSLQLVMRENGAAATHLGEGLAICERDGLHATRSYILTNLAEVAMRSGDLDSGQSHAEKAIAAATETGNRAVAAWAQLKAARLALRRREPGQARALLAEGIRASLSIGLPTLKIDGAACFAEILAAQDEPLLARAVLDFTIGHPAVTPADRGELLDVARRLPGDGATRRPWHGPELDRLLERVVAETTLAYAPLIADLRGE